LLGVYTAGGIGRRPNFKRTLAHSMTSPLAGSRRESQPVQFRHGLLRWSSHHRVIYLADGVTSCGTSACCASRVMQ